WACRRNRTSGLVRPKQECRRFTSRSAPRLAPRLTPSTRLRWLQVAATTGLRARARTTTPITTEPSSSIRTDTISKPFVTARPEKELQPLVCETLFHRRFRFAAGRGQPLLRAKLARTPNQVRRRRACRQLDRRLGANHRRQAQGPDRAACRRREPPCRRRHRGHGLRRQVASRWLHHGDVLQ